MSVVSSSTSSTGTTRRALLRTAAATASTVAVAPVVLPLVPALSGGAVAATASTGAAGGAMTLRQAKKCKRVKVKVGGRVKTRMVCRPKKKASGTAPTSPTPASAKKTGKSGTTGTTGTTGTQVPAPTPLAPGGLLSAADRHLVSRFSYGVDRAQADQALAAGGATPWFEAQLQAPGSSDPATDGVLAWWPSLSRSAQDIWTREQAGTEGGWQVMTDYQRYVLVRRLRSTRPVLDVMAELWENHFNVPVMGDGVYTYRVSYGLALRDRALGTFEDLLRTAVTHPAMLIYLNAAVSTKAHPNENLGRELLELHTVGRGQYTEDDVKASARILTGYRVDVWNTWVASYKPADHWTGAVRVMEFTHANTASDGRAVADAYLRYLARHPATAQRIVRKLAVKLVSDSPSQALVDQLAAVYLANDTAIAPVLRALVASPEFAASAGAKVRDPAEDVIATYKALGVQVAAPTPSRSGQSAETAILWQTANLGQTPHSWPRPDGAPTTNAAWSSTSRLLASLDLHWTMSGAWWPSEGISYRRPVDWLPSPTVTFSDLVEHLSRQILHTSTPPGLLTAATQAVGTAPQDVVSADHPVVKWKFSRLLTTVLDSPYFLKR